MGKMFKDDLCTTWEGDVNLEKVQDDTQVAMTRL